MNKKITAKQAKTIIPANEMPSFSFSYLRLYLQSELLLLT